MFQRLKTTVENWLKRLLAEVLREERLTARDVTEILDNTTRALHKRAGDIFATQASIISRAHNDAVDRLTALAEATRTDAADLKAHIVAESDKVKTAVVEHASQAVHSALSDIQKATYLTCATCTKLSADWKFVEGKIECADCSIRKTIEKF